MAAADKYQTGRRAGIPRNSRGYISGIQTQHKRGDRQTTPTGDVSNWERTQRNLVGGT